jgi:hypothetical protein
LANGDDISEYPMAHLGNYKNYKTLDRTGHSVTLNRIEMDIHVRNELYDPTAIQPLFLNYHAILQITAFLRNELNGGDDDNTNEHADILV